MRACQLNICSTIYKTPYNIFTRAAAFCGRFCVVSQKVHKCRKLEILHKISKMILCSRENFCL
nr:MAG TPA: hypothetical protein [Caudoviricetes sp.]